LLGFEVTAQNMPGPPEPVPLPHPDLAPPSIPAPGGPLWLIIGGSAVALVLFVLLLWLLFKQSAPATTSSTPPLSRAQKRLQELLLECDTLPPDETAHRVSMVLRDYQEGRYLVPAPYRTREELYEHGEFKTRDVVRQRFGPIATHSDRLAFAPVPATKEEARALVQESLDALQQEAYYLAEPLKSPPPLPGLPAASPPPLPQETTPPASP
jgi:hypothetical protein